MPEPLRDRLLRHRAANIAWNTAANQLNRFRHRAGASFVFHHREDTRAAAIRTAGYVRKMFDDYLRILPPGTSIEGRRVLEIGPGDQFGVALLFLARGAASVTCLDKYRATVDPAFLAFLYEELRNGLTPAEAERVRDLGPHGGPGGAAFRSIDDQPLEEARAFLAAASADLIVSRSVLEYLKQPARALAVLGELLATDGDMAHVVDCRDDGLFSSHGFHPLEFLTLSDATYAAMTSHTYRPNRWRIRHYLDELARLGFQTSTRTLRIVGRPDPVAEAAPVFTSADRDLFRPIRSRLDPAFAGLSDQDLLTAGFELHARRWDVSPTGTAG